MYVNNSVLPVLWFISKSRYWLYNHSNTEAAINLNFQVVGTKVTEWTSGTDPITKNLAPIIRHHVLSSTWSVSIVKLNVLPPTGRCQ